MNKGLTPFVVVIPVLGEEIRQNYKFYIAWS